MFYFTFFEPETENFRFVYKSRSKLRHIEYECSRREKQREESSAVNSGEFSLVPAGICCVCDSKSLNYFVLTPKIDQFQAYKNS